MKTLNLYVQREFYDWYSEGKDHDIRVPRGTFSADKIIQGRSLVLYKGNSGISAGGEIGEVITSSLDKILGRISYQRFAPNISSENLFRQSVHQLLGSHEQYIAFQVILDQ